MTWGCLHLYFPLLPSGKKHCNYSGGFPIFSLIKLRAPVPCALATSPGTES